MVKINKQLAFARRKARVRSQIAGTASCPRLAIFRSNTSIYAQLIDDDKSITLASASSIKEAKLNIEAAEKVGEAIAKAAADKKIKSVVFDRSGYIYHGKVKALADAARKAGLKF